MKNFWTKLASAAVALVASAGLSYAIFTTSVDRIIGAGTTVPVVSACGTGALTAGSTDTAGAFNTTGGAICTLTFGQAWATVPTCVVTELGANLATRVVTLSTTALAISGGTSGGSYTYICFGKQGG